MSHKANSMDIFVQRPVLALVLSAVIILAGIGATRSIPILQFPQMESASLQVSTVYVGASADVVQGFVTEPIERVMSTIPGVDYVDSRTMAGLSTVTAWLKLNENSTDALAEATARLSQIRFELPAGAENPAVSVTRADSQNALFYLDVFSEQMSRAQVSDYLNRNVNPVLSSIDGVQRVALEGGRNPAMRVWIDPMKLASFDLGASDVMAALQANNIIATVGNSENSRQRINLLANTTLRSVDDFENIVINRKDGTLLRLKDIAQVEMGEEEGEVDARYTKRSTTFISVWPMPGANEIEVGDAVYAVLEKINPTLPADMRIDHGYDGTIYMRNSLKEIFTTLAETVVLVGIVVIALMGSFRTALVPLVTIPISILGAIAAMSLLGFSLNLLTVLAIVLSVGLVVDDAIVVVENVARYMRQGMSRTQAALISSRQLLVPIIAMTLTLAAVYAPIGFLSGLTGLLFREFAFTLAVAVLISGIVAITLSPIMSAYVSPEGGKEGRLTVWVNQRFEQLQNLYLTFLNGVFAWRPQVIFAAIFIALLSVPFYLLSQKELAPVEDQSSILVVLESSPESSIEYTVNEMNHVVDQLMSLESAQGVWQILRAAGGFSGVNLGETNEREQSVQEVLPQLFGELSGIAGVRALPILPSALPTAGQFDVELVVQGPDDYATMRNYVDQLLAAGFASGKFLFVDSDLKVDLPQVKLKLDRERIADLGMNINTVSQQLSALMSGNFVNRFDADGKAYQVIPRVKNNARNNAEQILNLRIRTPSGDLLPLSAMATLEQEIAPRALGKFNQQKSFRIMGGVIPGFTKEQGLATLEQAAAEILPQTYSIDYAGESRQLRQEGNTLIGVLLVALVVVYLVLTVQFNSFRDPLVVLLGSVPLALAGALMLPFISLTSVNIYSQIGLITLVGLIAKNGILIVEFANHLQEQGLDKLNAAKQAAITRLRPVLMTTAATVLGHFPLVLVTGPGAEARNSIGIILVGGMIIGTLFTLVILPVIYQMLAEDRHGHKHEEEQCEIEGTFVTHT
jgi:multidrug efflux pump